MDAKVITYVMAIESNDYAELSSKIRKFGYTKQTVDYANIGNDVQGEAIEIYTEKLQNDICYINKDNGRFAHYGRYWWYEYVKDGIAYGYYIDVERKDLNKLRSLYTCGRCYTTHEEKGFCRHCSRSKFIRRSEYGLIKLERFLDERTNELTPPEELYIETIVHITLTEQAHLSFIEHLQKLNDEFVTQTDTYFLKKQSPALPVWTRTGKTYLVG